MYKNLRFVEDASCIKAMFVNDKCYVPKKKFKNAAKIWNGSFICDFNTRGRSSFHLASTGLRENLTNILEGDQALSC